MVNVLKSFAEQFEGAINEGEISHDNLEEALISVFRMKLAAKFLRRQRTYIWARTSSKSDRNGRRA